MAVTVEACTTEKTAAFRRLVSDIRRVVQAQPGAANVGRAVAELLQPYLGSDEFLPCDQLAPSTCDYCQHILHVEEDGSFSIVALVWLPGQSTPIHDHVSWCVVGVHKGEEHETVYTRDAAHLRVAGNHVNPPGSVAVCIPPGDIHEVANRGDGVAVSLHIYGANISVLGSSIRRRYDLEVRAA